MPMTSSPAERTKEIQKAIVEIEWVMFQEVHGIGGRAACQDNREGFVMHRLSQFSSWEPYVLESYLLDLQEAVTVGRNLVMEKYAYMMEITDPAYFAQIKHLLPPVDEDCYELADMITEQYLIWEKEVDMMYPNVRKHGRPTDDTTLDGSTSFRNYLRSELLTYSKKTLIQLYSSILAFPEVNRYLQSMEYLARAYGYKTLAEAEAALSK